MRETPRNVPGALAVPVPIWPRWALGFTRGGGVGQDELGQDGSGQPGSGQNWAAAFPAESPAPPAPLVLVAPITGRVLPLAQVPDPVFAGGMVGDGLAIDPEEGQLVAPCCARVAIIAEGGHGFGLTTDSGLEILIHLGIDTVELKGRGFTVRVAPGDEVDRGQPLASFDLDLIRAAGKSAVSPVVVANREHVEKLESNVSGVVRAGRDPIMRVWPKR